jgi:hypothetical protein
MRTHASHLGSVRIATSVRAHATAWLIAAVLAAVGATGLSLSLVSGSGSGSGSGMNGPSISPASVTGTFVYPPAQRLSSGKYLYP